jgi:hypothetical protein
VSEIAVSEEEVFFQIQKPADTEIVNYSYPTYFNYDLSVNDSLAPYKNLTEDGIITSTVIDTLDTKGLYYAELNTINKSTNTIAKEIIEFNETSYIQYNSSYYFSISWWYGFRVSNLTESGRILTLSNDSIGSLTGITVDTNLTHFNFAFNDIENTNISIPVSDHNIKFGSNATNILIYNNNVLIVNQTHTAEVLSSTMQWLTFGTFVANESFSGNLHQIFHAYLDISTIDMYIPDENPSLPTYQLKNAFLGNLLAYESTIFQFKANSTSDYSSFNFQARFNYTTNANIIFSRNKTSEQIFRIGQIEGLGWSFSVQNISFNLIYTNESGIFFYHDYTLNYSLTPSLNSLNFSEISILFDESAYLLGWNSDMSFKLFPQDNIDTQTFVLFNVYNSQPLNRVNEFHEPIIGQLYSEIFAYYGTINYPNKNQLADSDIFICDRMFSNSICYLRNDSDYYIVSTGFVGMSYINFDQENQNRSYFRLWYSITNNIYKCMISMYNYNTNIVVNRIIESQYPIQIEFFYDSTDSTFELLNYNEYFFKVQSNGSVGLFNTQNSIFHVLDEHPSSQTWDSSDYTRVFISTTLEKELSSNVDNLMFERLINVNSSLEIVNSEISSASAYTDIATDISELNTYNSKLTHSLAFLMNYDVVLAMNVFSHIASQIIDISQQEPSSASFWNNKVIDVLVSTFLPVAKGNTFSFLNSFLKATSGATVNLENVDPNIATDNTPWYGGISSFIEESLDTIINIDLNLDGLFDDLLSGISDLMSTALTSVVEAFLPIIESIRTTFYTLTENLLQDMIDMSAVLNIYNPTSNDLTVAFYSVGFLDNDIDTFRIILNSAWLLGTLAENQTVLSFLIMLGINALIFFVVPSGVHFVKRNAMITYAALVINSFIFMGLGLIELGFGIIALALSSVLFVIYLKRKRSEL